MRRPRTPTSWELEQRNLTMWQWIAMRAIDAGGRIGATDLMVFETNHWYEDIHRVRGDLGHLVELGFATVEEGPSWRAVLTDAGRTALAEPLASTEEQTPILKARRAEADARLAREGAVRSARAAAEEAAAAGSNEVPFPVLPGAR